MATIWLISYFALLIAARFAWGDYSRMTEFVSSQSTFDNFEKPAEEYKVTEIIEYAKAIEGNGDNVIADMKCGCGRPVRYLIRKNSHVELSCNKYMKCRDIEKSIN